MSRNKKKNSIDQLETLQLFSVYGFREEKMNWYQYRLRKEDPRDNLSFDWYFTTGKLVMNVKTKLGTRSYSAGTYLEPEEVCLAILKRFYK